MHLPLDYPRINQFPEWFTTDCQKPYVVRDIGAETQQTVTGEQLQKGMRVELKPSVELRWKVHSLQWDDALPCGVEQGAKTAENTHISSFGGATVGAVSDRLAPEPSELIALSPSLPEVVHKNSGYYYVAECVE